MSLRLRIVLAATALALGVVGAGMAFGVGREQQKACFSTKHHVVVQPKEGPGRPPVCPYRP
jgi:hypothetical protein